MEKLICIALTTLLFFTHWDAFNEVKEEIPSFALEEYESMIKEHPSVLVLGPVLNAEAAEGFAEKIWIETYEGKLGESLAKLKPYKVYYNAEKQVWFVHGTLPEGWWGGYGYTLIQAQDGRVLATWFEQ